MAELDHANVVAGDGCLVDTAYGIDAWRGAASYKERPDSSVVVRAASGDALRFEIDESILEPSNDNTKKTLESYGCNDGITVGLKNNVGEISDDTFVVPFDTMRSHLAS